MSSSDNSSCCLICKQTRGSTCQNGYYNGAARPTAPASCTSCGSGHVGLSAALCEHQPALNQAKILSTHRKGRSSCYNGSTELNILAPLQAGDHQMEENQYHYREQQYIRHGQSASMNMVPPSHWGSTGNCNYRAKGIYRRPGSNFNDDDDEVAAAVAGTGTAARTDEAEAEDGKERLPPHELLAREWAEATSCGGAAFSLCQGVGRTLKGRDLRRVRNAILKQTGFI